MNASEPRPDDAHSRLTPSAPRLPFAFRRAAARTLIACLAPAVLAWGCGDAPPREEQQPREPDPRISTENPRESLTELDYGELDPSEVAVTLPWSRNNIMRDASAAGNPKRLTGVATARSRGYDRVVFAFPDGLPGYRIAMTTEGGGCDGAGPASDAPAHLLVQFDRARASDGTGPFVDDRERDTGFPALADAVQTCDENDTVRWLLGVTGDVRYRMMEIIGEPRLVVDLEHPDGG